LWHGVLRLLVHLIPSASSMSFFFENAWINYCPLLKNGVDHDGQCERVDTNNSEIEVVTLCLDVVKVCMIASNVVEKAPFSILSCVKVHYFFVVTTVAALPRCLLLALLRSALVSKCCLLTFTVLQPLHWS
jgi:hypothetical protein